MDEMKRLNLLLVKVYKWNNLKGKKLKKKKDLKGKSFPLKISHVVTFNVNVSGGRLLEIKHSGNIWNMFGWEWQWS